MSEYSATGAASPDLISYSFESLMKLGASHNNSSTASSIRSQLEEQFPEITEDGTIVFQPSAEDGFFIYGDVVTRTDLSWKQVNDLKRAVQAMGLEDSPVEPTVSISKMQKHQPVIIDHWASFRSQRTERHSRDNLRRNGCDPSSNGRRSDAPSWRSTKPPSTNSWRLPSRPLIGQTA